MNSLTNEKIIQPGSEVHMHFAIKLTDGTIADSTREQGKPACFTLGDGNVLDKVESALIGLKVGDKKKITLTPEEGFGVANPDNLHWLPKAQFPQDLSLEPGLIMGFNQPNGIELPGIIREIKDNEVLVDFNHPLCDQTLIFDLEIMAVDTSQDSFPSPRRGEGVT
jgi:FKBP-type peptidyl-prolyl cis-trans isomerase SlpA